MPDGFRLRPLGLSAIGTPRRPDALDAYRPRPDEVAETVARRNEQPETSLFSDILEAPSVLFGAHAIRGAIKGAKEGGLSGFAEGLYAGSPTTALTDFFGLTDDFRRTYTADIRAAFGQQAQDGVGNFILNTAGDILTDPSSFVTIFGKTAQGVAKGMDIAAGLAQGIRNGERAALVFKYPFMPRVAFGLYEGEQVARKMGFQSMSLNLAEGLDKWAAFVRTGPLGQIARKFSVNMPPIADPEMARAVARAGQDLLAAPAAMESAFLQVFAQTPREAQDYLLSSPAAQRVVREMRERGLRGFDEAHTLREMLSAPAAGVTDGSAVARAGKIAGVGDQRTALEIGRDVATDSAAVREAGVIDAARGRVLGDLDEVMAKLKDDPALREGLDKYLANSVGFMRRVGDKEMAEGVLNGMLEHYVPRSVRPEAAELINKRFSAFVAEGGQKSINLAAGFMKGRKFTDLTTVEANAVMWELGSKATGHIGLKDLDAAAPGGMEGVFAKVFDSKFVRALRGVDDDAADFFAVNPIHADFLRARASGQVMGSARYRRMAIRAISKADFAAGELPANAAEIQKLTEAGYVPVLEGKGGRLTPQNEAAFVGQMAGYDGEARFLLARDRLRASVDGIIDAEGADYDATVESLRRARDSHKGDLRILDSDDEATVMVKTARQERDAAESFHSSLLAAERLNARGRAGAAFVEAPGGGAVRDFTAQGLYDDAARSVEKRIADVDFLRSEKDRLARAEQGIADEVAALRRRRASLSAAAKDAEKAANESAKDFNFYADRADYESGAASRGADRAAAADRAAERAAAAKASGGVEVEEGIADAQKRLEAVREQAAYLAGFKDEAALLRSPDLRKKLVAAELRERASDAADRVRRARLNDRAARGAVQSQIDELGDDFRQWRDSTFSDRAAAEAELKNLKNLGTHGAEVAKRIRGYRAAARDGFLSFDALTPEQRAAVARRAPDARVHFVAPDDLRGVVEHYKDLTRPDPFRKYAVVRGIDAMTSVWKAWTVGNVAFLNSRVRDVVTGLVTLNFARGGLLSPSAAWDAGKAANVFRKVMGGGGTVEELGTEVIKGVAHKDAPQTIGSVLRYMTDNGALDSGLLRDVVAESAAQATRLGGGTRLTDFLTRNVFHWDPKKNPFTRAGFEVANFGDNFVKLTGFIDQLKQGRSAEEALDFIRRFTYSPGSNATSFMRHTVRRVFPFATFTRWAVGTTVDQFLARPASATWIETVQRNAERATGVDADLERVLPDFVRDGIGVPYKMRPEGPSYFLFGGYFPAAEVAKLASVIESIPKDGDDGKAGPVYKYLVSQMNPFAKAAIERVANRDSFSGAEIEAYAGQSKEMFGVAMPAHAHQLLRNIRLLAAVDQLNVVNLEQAKVMAGAVERGRVLDSREELPFAERLVTSPFGLAPRAYQIDVSEQVREARRFADKRRYEAAARLRRAVEAEPSGPKRDRNIAALRQELVEAAADERQADSVARRFGADETIRRKSNALRALGAGPR